MRGSTKYQVQTLFRESGIDQIGTSKHHAKELVRQEFAAMDKRASWHDIGQNTGIHGISTANDYQQVWRQILEFAKETEGIRDIEKLTGAIVANFLESRVELGIAKDSFDKYASAAEKLSVALNGYSAMVGHGNIYSFTDAIKPVRALARAELDSTQQARAYTDPRQLVAAVQRPDYQLASSIQLEAGSRFRETSNITVRNLQGLKVDPHTGQTMGWYATQGKGGKSLEKMVSPATYSLLEKHIQTHGAFRIDGSSYRESLKAAAAASQQQYHGSHGLRWNFAQERYKELQTHCLSATEALQVVSTELGHNRIDITMHYLRG